MSLCLHVQYCLRPLHLLCGCPRGGAVMVRHFFILILFILEQASQDSCFLPLVIPCACVLGFAILSRVFVYLIIPVSYRFWLGDCLFRKIGRVIARPSYWSMCHNCQFCGSTKLWYLPTNFTIYGISSLWHVSCPAKLLWWWSLLLPLFYLPCHMGTAAFYFWSLSILRLSMYPKFFRVSAIK